MGSPRGSKPISEQITEVDPHLDGSGVSESGITTGTGLTPVSQADDTLDPFRFRRTSITQDTDVVKIDDYELERGAKLGEFEVFSKLGEGGMGVVFAAIHPLIGKRAAIKVLKHEFCEDPTSIERFIAEARIVNQIGHPNIVDIFAFGEMPDGRRYFAMEWLLGETLRERLRRGRMSLVEMARTMKSVARALEAAHNKNVLHRDVKPENIFLSDIAHDEPLVKLLDFGVAKLATEDRSMVLTERGQLLGTPTYLAPERATAPSEVIFASDIYSLGAIMFECLTGRPPFLAKNTVEMITSHVTLMPPVPSSLAPEVPEEIDRLILEMLAKDPNRRPTLAHVREMLSRVSDPAELDQRPRRITARRPGDGASFSQFTGIHSRFPAPRPIGAAASTPRMPAIRSSVTPTTPPAPRRGWGPWLAVFAVLATIAALFALGTIRLAP